MSSKLEEYFKGDELAKNVWKSKYAADGETHYDQMHRRLAKEFARIETINRVVRGSKKWNDSVSKLSEYGSSFESLSEEHIYNLFKDFRYVVPQGSIMATLGTGVVASLSNCFVLGEPQDSYGGIFQKDEEMVQLMKRRGGVGIDISTLRPKDTSVSNSAKTTTGAVSFMHRFSNSTKEVAQNGRRGALMLSIHINHPDVMDFIKIKRDNTSVTGANISIKINNEFMKAVENDEDYVLRFPCDSNFNEEEKEAQQVHEYNKLVSYYDNRFSKKIKAKEYWDEIIKSAHGHAEPGIIFEDNHHNYSPDGVYEQYKGITTNPCGEIFMQEYDACRLIAVNLFSFVDEPFTKEAKFNFNKFYEVNYDSMRLSDDLIDLELEHIDRILTKIQSDTEAQEVKERELKLWNKVKQTAQYSRRTGLGFTALADTLAALGLKYDSDEGLEVIEQIMKTKMESELDCTIDLAILRGTFEGWNYNKEFYNREGDVYQIGNLPLEFGANDFYDFILYNFPTQFKRMMKYGRRNVSWSTVAPTGSVSILTQTTSGLEPLFQPFYMRRKKINPGEDGVRVDFVDEVGDSWQEFPVLHPKFKEWAEEYTETIGIENYSKEYLEELFEKSPWYGSTAEDIDWVKRVEIQGIIQKYISHSISSTVNLPSDVTEEEVAEIYSEAWKKGLKGVTVYRDGSRSGVLISESDNKKLVTFNENHAPKRPKSLACKIVRFNNNYEKWVAFVGLMDNKPYEVFTGKLENVDLPNGVDFGEILKNRNEEGEKRYDFVFEGGLIEGISSVSSSEYWNYGKLFSGMLRHGMPLVYVVDTINSLNWGSDHINTWKAGIVRALKKFIKDGKAVGFKCNDCSSEQVIFEEGCLRCLDCGSSACG